jgi:hypothetical protein
MPGEKIGEGYVEVTVDIDDNGLNGATEKVTRKVDDDLTKAAPGIGEEVGKGLGDGLEKGIGPSGEKAARNFKENFEQHKSEFLAFAKTFGDDFYKQFNGNGEAALSELNKLFNKEFDSGGLDASNVWWKAFDKSVKSAAPKSASGLFESFGIAAEKAGVEGGDVFGNGIIDGAKNAFKIFSELPPEVQLAVGGAAATAGLLFGSFLAASASAAILGVLGGGALAAGIIAEAKNPEVSAAFSGMANTVQADLEQAASPFIDRLVGSAGIIRDTFDSEMPDLENLFNTLAPSITRLTDGASQFVQELVQGADEAGPQMANVLGAVADILPVIGGGLKEMMSEIADGGQGAADAIRVIGTTLAGLLIFIGFILDEGSTMFEGMMNGARTALIPLEYLLKALSGVPGIGGAAKSALKDLNDTFYGGETSSKRAASGVKDFGDTTEKAAQAAKEADDAVQKLFDDFNNDAKASLNADESMIAYKNSLVQLKAALDGSDKSLDLNTAAGRALKQQFDQTATAALDSADAVRKNAENSGANGVQAAHAYSAALAGNISELAATAEQAGMSRAATANLIATLFGIPKDVATEFATPGAAAAKQAAEDLEYAIQAIETKKEIDIYVNTHYSKTTQNTPGYSQYGFGSYRYGGIRHAATGLLDAGVYNDGPVVFAEPETGGEAFIPRLTNDPLRSMNILAEAASWYGLSLAPNNTSPATTPGANPASAPARGTGGSGKTINLYYNGAPPSGTDKQRMFRDLDLAVL